MKWILTNSASNVSEYQMTGDDGSKVVFKFSESQQTIRMRFNEYYGVFVLDEGSFEAKKIAIRNIYGSEIGLLTKSLLRETSGSVLLDDFPQKIDYLFTPQKSLIEMNSDTTIFIDVAKRVDADLNIASLLSIIVFSWMQSVISDKVAAVH